MEIPGSTARPQQLSFVWEIDELKEAQEQDQAIGPLYAAKTGEPPPLKSIYQFASAQPDRERTLWLQWESLQLVNGILQRKHTWGEHGEHAVYVVVLPEKYRTGVFQQMHRTYAPDHLSWMATLQQLQKHVYWPGMKEDIQRWIGGCEWCRPSPTQATVNPMRHNPISSSD
jgi:hypothetical protein